MNCKQEVTCPSCQHKHYVEMELTNFFFKRNQELEEAFREVLIHCLKHIPLYVDTDIAKARASKP